MTYLDYLTSPLGLLQITATDTGVSTVWFVDKKEKEISGNEIISACKKQLEEYFAGNRTDFSLPFDLSGTEFQKKVWHRLLKIPFGKTISYMQVALDLGDVKSIRAVGTANGKNPVAVIIPCHRVIGSNGSLVGYGGGLWRKKWLIEFESKSKQKELF